MSATTTKKKHKFSARGVPDELSPRQAEFVNQYCIDRNATNAAKRAGYAESGAHVRGSELLKISKIQAAITKRLSELAIVTETDAQWVRRRLKEEAEDFSEFASHAARVRAIELVAKLNGLFAEDNKQRVGELAALLQRLDGNVWTPVEGAPGLAIEMDGDD